MPVCHYVWSCRTFVRDRNESDKTAPTACYWCPGCLLLQQHEKKNPHKIMVNRTTCRKLSPNIWKTLIIMIINGNKENTLSKVIYKLFQVLCYIFLINYIICVYRPLFVMCEEQDLRTSCMNCEDTYFVARTLSTPCNVLVVHNTFILGELTFYSQSINANTITTWSTCLLSDVGDPCILKKLYNRRLQLSWIKIKHQIYRTLVHLQ